MEKIINLQVALFFDNIMKRPDRIINDLNDAMGNLFDGIPQVIDLPLETPSEIPMVMLKSEDGLYSCNLARGRIDFFYNFNTNEKEWSSILKDFITKAQNLIKFIYKEQEINRFGLIGNFFIDDKNPVWQINNKYIKNNLGELNELLIRYNKVETMYGMTLNNIYHVEAGFNFLTQTKGVTIQRDINNVPEEKILSLDSINNTIKKCIENYSFEEIKNLVR